MTLADIIDDVTHGAGFPRGGPGPKPGTYFMPDARVQYKIMKKVKRKSDKAKKRGLLIEPEPSTAPQPKSPSNPAE